MRSWAIESAVIELPSGRLARLTPDDSSGVCRDGVSWDGTIRHGDDDRAAIADARAALFGEDDR